MTAFVLLYLIASVAALMAAWLKGGHPERLGAAIWLAAWVVAFPLNDFRIGDLRVAVATVDLLSFAAYLWLALRYERWWPLGVSACLVLTIAIHASALLIPDLNALGEASAQLGLGMLAVILLGAGAFERWLAGERAVSASAIWTRRRRTP